jgi:hypothetical protein
MALFEDLQHQEGREKLDAHNTAGRKPGWPRYYRRSMVFYGLEDGVHVLVGIDQSVGVVQLFKGVGVGQAHQGHAFFLCEILGFKIEVQLSRVQMAVLDCVEQN